MGRRRAVEGDVAVKSNPPLSDPAAVSIPKLGRRVCYPNVPARATGRWNGWKRLGSGRARESTAIPPFGRADPREHRSSGRTEANPAEQLEASLREKSGERLDGCVRVITRFGIFFCSLAMLLCITAAAQTFEISPQGGAAPPPAESPGARTNRSKPRAQAPASSGLGWGSNIEVARQSRAAEAALQKGDYATAAQYAQRAANAA